MAILEISFFLKKIVKTIFTSRRVSRITSFEHLSPVVPSGLEVGHLLLVDEVQHLLAMLLR